jgi:hypothetical protein
VTCLNELISNLHLGEGRWERPYRDHLGYLAIGWGFLIDERKSVALPRLPLRITQDLQAPLTCLISSDHCYLEHGRL